MHPVTQTLVVEHFLMGVHLPKGVVQGKWSLCFFFLRKDKEVAMAEARPGIKCYVREGASALPCPHRLMAPTAPQDFPPIRRQTTSRKLRLLKTFESRRVLQSQGGAKQQVLQN